MNNKMLAAFKGDLSAAIAAQKDCPVKYGLEFCDIASLAKLFLHNEGKNNIIYIIKKRSRYHLDQVKEETRKSNLYTMILRVNNKSTHSVLNSAELDKSRSQDIDHG